MIIRQRHRTPLRERQRAWIEDFPSERKADCENDDDDGAYNRTA
jgi:uncharacterized protein YecT (DUF1311 family)